MKKTIALIISIAILATLVMPTFAANNEPSIDNETKVITTEASADTVQANTEKASDKVKKNDVAAFKSAFASSFGILNGLRAKANKNWETIKSLNASIKSAMTAFKTSLQNLKPEERKTKVKAMSESLAPLHAQVKAIHTDIKSLRDQKQAAWTAFRTAVKAKDQKAATTALDSILSLKQQIIDKQEALITVKQQILDILK